RASGGLALAAGGLAQSLGLREKIVLADHRQLDFLDAHDEAVALAQVVVSQPGARDSGARGQPPECKQTRRDVHRAEAFMKASSVSSSLCICLKELLPGSGTVARYGRQHPGG